MIRKFIILFLLSLLFILFLIAEFNKHKVISWKMNFSGISKDPYGCIVLRETIEKNPGLNFYLTSNQTFYTSLSQLKEDSLISYLVITDKFTVDSINLKSIYDFVKQGNNFMISAYTFDNLLKDSLKFDKKKFNLAFLYSSPETLNFVNPVLQMKNPAIFSNIGNMEFSGIDTLKHIVLGTDNAGNANFIKVPYGKGAFYLHCQPLVFTNYHLLYSNSEYAYNALSYFTDTRLVWDDYYKPQVARYTTQTRTPLRYFLSKEPLRIAIYLILILTGIYFLIESKRKQRFIPILKPLENSTLKFVSTVARLYQGQPDYKKMALKKYLYLKEMVYSRYQIRLDENDPATADQFSGKTGFSISKIKELYIICRRIESSISIDAETLITFSRMVDEIYEFEKEK